MAKIVDNLKGIFSKKDKQQLTETIPVVSLYDRFSSYPSAGLTPRGLASLLKEADTGDVYRQMELFSEMLEKDAKLLSVFQARQLAVTRRNQNVVPFSTKPKDLKIAEDVEIAFKGLRHWKHIIGNIADCVPKGFSVNQIHWVYKDGKYTFDDITFVDQKKFRFGKVTDLYSDPNELRMRIDPNRIEFYRGIFSDEELQGSLINGVSLENDLIVRQRFIIARSHAMSGLTSRSSLMRPLTYLYLFKNYDIKWWLKFAEVLLGYRIGKYDTSQPEQKDLLITAIRGLAEDSAAVMSKDSTIEFVEMAGKATSHQIYSDIQKWVDDSYGQLVLGHTGSSQATPGKLGGEDMAKEVKQEFVESGAETVDEAISNDLFKPYVIANYGPQEGYPYCQTDISQALDMEKETKIDMNLQAMGFKLTTRYVKEKYGRPLPNPDDPEDTILTPSPTKVNNNFSPAGGDQTVAADGKKKLLTQR
jgi:phage gp29-like protein